MHLVRGRAQNKFSLDVAVAVPVCYDVQCVGAVTFGIFLSPFAWSRSVWVRYLENHQLKLSKEFQRNSLVKVVKEIFDIINLKMIWIGTYKTC
jgi:hypothetical protein